MLGIQSPVSAYLVQPKLRPHQQRDWSRFNTLLTQIHRRNPHLLQHSLIALLVWCGVVGSIQSLFAVSTPSSQAATATTGEGLASKPIDTATTSSPRANFATAVHASVLPSGPSGQLLPPGTVAPDRTYPNRYARGQCTWYVASRRQIPPNWGNAVSWYYHASASGWSVGTVPAVAAVAWTPYGRYGHVALVEKVSADARSVYVSEMNYRGIGVKSFRWVPASQFKYIY